jgi:hypothetical protein
MNCREKHRLLAELAELAEYDAAALRLSHAEGDLAKRVADEGASDPPALARVRPCAREAVPHSPRCANPVRGFGHDTQIRVARYIVDSQRTRRAVTARPLTQESHLPGGLCKALDLGADTVAYGGVDTLGEDPRQARLDALERRRRCFDE